MKADYAAWLTPDRLAEEERLWGSDYTRTWPDFIAAIERVDSISNLKGRFIQTMIEFGCGTGWVARYIPFGLIYHGVDSNEECIARARDRNPGLSFTCCDLRKHALPPTGLDLSCAFSVMKHFGLHEWDAVLAKVLSPGRWGLFSIPLLPDDAQDFDDGVEFPHVHIRRSRVLRAVENAGRQVYGMDPLPWGETMVTTCMT